MAPTPLIWKETSRRRPNAAAKSEQEWNGHKELLYRLYVLEDKTLDHIKGFMENEHSFSASYVHSTTRNYPDSPFDQLASASQDRISADGFS